MIKSTTIVGLSGSLRKASSNTKLLKYTEKKIKLIDEGIHFSFGNIDLPLYNDDLEKEKGMPATVIKLGETLSRASGIIISTCLLYTSPSPRDLSTSRMPSSA